MGLKSQKAEEKEDPLQAVVIADTFDDTFADFCESQPRCLLPLLGVPLIDYTFDFLARSGIQDVYLYSTHFPEQVEAHIQSSSWRTPSSTSPFKKLVLFRSTASTCVGDVLRDLEQKAILTSDFVLITGGDVVADFTLGSAMKRHRTRRETDKNAISTVILRDLGIRASHHLSDQQSLATFVVDPLKDRCLHYESPLPERASRKSRTWLSLDPDLLSHAELDVYQNLDDLHIDICTPDVLGLWSDNFDNQTLRTDFLHGILKDYELNGKTVHTHIVKYGYGARVADEHQHAQITKDIQQGWCGPMSFDYNLPPFPEEADPSAHLSNGNGPQTNGILTRNSSFSSVSSDASDRSSTTAPLSPLPTVSTPTHSRNVSVTAATITPTTSVSSNALNPAISNADDPAAPASSQFHHEAQSTLLHRFSTSASPSDIQVELMGLRFATNANESQVRRAVATSIARHLLSSLPTPSNTTASSPPSTTQPTSISDHITVFLNKYRSLIRRDTANAQPTPTTEQNETETETQIEFLQTFERALNAYAVPSRRLHHVRRASSSSHRSNSNDGDSGSASEAELISLASRILLFTCKELYDMEVFGEESFLGWWGDDYGDGDGDSGHDSNINQSEEGGDGIHSLANASREKEAAIREQSKQFIRWLREAESESEEGDEDDE